jgi:hypothetical protein
MFGTALLGSVYLASATAQTPGLPPPLPDAAKAARWARASIARSNATRSNYIRPHITVLLTMYRYPNPPQTVDVTAHVRADTLRVSQAINDQPDTASLTLQPETPPAWVPQVGDVIAVGLATEGTPTSTPPLRIAGGLEFAGPVIVVQHDRRQGNKSPWVSVQCTDWLPFLDAQLVNASWPAQSATTTIQDLLANYVNWSRLLTAPLPFTLDFVAANLPNCQAFEAINWRPSEVLRHLTNEIDGGFYVDARRRLHAWANGAEPNQSNPRPLTNYLWSLKTFRHTVDATQVRKSVIVEGMARTTLTDVARVAQDVYGGATYLGGVPVSEAAPFAGSGWQRARLGSQWVNQQQLAAHALQPSGQNPFAAAVVSYTAPTASAAGALVVDNYPPWLPVPAAGAPGWVKIGEQLLRYESPVALGGGRWNLQNLTTYAFGLPLGPIAAGDTVTWVDWIDQWQGVAHRPGVTTEPLRDAVAGSPLVLIAEAVDPDLNAAFAVPLPPTEELVQDERYGYAGALQRATSDVDAFRFPLISAEWETEDTNARVGRPQDILLTDVDPVSASLTILTIDVTFPLRTLLPRRACKASTVQPATLLQVVTTEN